MTHAPISCLVASDLSPRGDRALVRAFRIAQRGGGRVDILHVVENDYPRRLADTLAHEVYSELRTQVAAMPESKGVHWTIRVERGHDHERIAEVAACIQADVLVLGGRREPKIRDLFLASTAQRVVRQSPIPVLVVKQPYRGPYGAAVAAVAAVDRSQHCKDAVGFALATFPELFVSAFYVRGGPLIVPAEQGALAQQAPPSAEEAEAIAAPLYALEDFKKRGQFSPLAGELLEIIPQAVQEIRPDLVICGRSKSARSFFLGEDLAGFAMMSIDRDLLIMP
jgi:nucleotide-binding universal stress UspA family protein